MSDPDIMQIAKMVEDVTMIPFEKISATGKNGLYILPRVLFVHECISIGINVSVIKELLNRDYSTIVYYSKRYDKLLIFDQYFKSLVESVKMWKEKNKSPKTPILNNQIRQDV